MSLRHEDEPQNATPAAALLAAWQSTHALWRTARTGTLPHEVAVLAAQTHATADRAVSEAKRAGLVVVERDRQRYVTAIWAAGDGT